MSDLSSLLGNQAKGYSITHNNKTFVASALTQKVKADYERGLKERALSAMEALPPARYDTQFAKFVEDVAVGRYSFHGDVAQRALSTPGGSLLLLSAVFGCTEDEAVELLTHQAERVMSILTLIVEEAKPSKNG